MSLSLFTAVVPSNHDELEQAQALKNRLCHLSDEFMNALQLTHVWVSKYFFDGRYMDITNDLSWKEIMVYHNLYGDFTKIFLEPLKTNNTKPIFLTWQADPPGNFRLLQKIYHYGIMSGFNILIRHSDHIENYGFGGSQRTLETSSNLPSQEELVMFCLYLREALFKANNPRELILGDTGQYFYPPRKTKGYSLAPIPRFFSFYCNHQKAKLSQRQLICLSLLAKGYDQKDIARIMDISSRTVEYHFNQIKLKFNDPAKLELISKFNASPLVGVNPFLLLETKVPDISQK